MSFCWVLVLFVGFFTHTADQNSQRTEVKSLPFNRILEGIDFLFSARKSPTRGNTGSLASANCVSGTGEVKAAILTQVDVDDLFTLRSLFSHYLSLVRVQLAM